MKNFKNHSLKKQFYIISSILLLICFLLTHLVTTNIKKLLLEKQIAYSTSSALRFKTEISYLYNRISTIYDILQFDENIEQLLSSPFTSDTMNQLKNIKRSLLSLSIMNHDIADIALVGETFCYSALFDDKTIGKFIDLSSQSSNLDSLGIMSSPFIGDHDTEYLVFQKAIFGLHNSDSFGKILGHIVIAINPLKSSIFLPEDSYEETTYFMIIDKFHNVYPFNCTDELSYQIIDTAIPPEIFSSHTTSDSIKSETDDYLVYTSFIPKMDYYVISAIDKNQLLLQLKEIYFLIYLIIGSIITFIFISMHLLLSNILNPLNKFYLFIKSIGEGNMRNLKSPILLDGSSEIITLSSAFNHMISEITALNKQIFSTTSRLYELEIEKNKSEISHLRSQINPHFLYNTLESIRGLAIEHQIPTIAQISVSMGKIFRYSIKGDSHALVDDEINIVTSYLAIQLVRFDNKFEVIYSVMPASKHLVVPKMILQPLVENAIFHGLEPKHCNGLLYIGTRVDDAMLCIIIQDDGMGIREETLAKIQSQLFSPPATNTSHIGLLNVHNRIRLEFGEPYGISIESSEHTGTKITILLPIQNSGGSYV